MANPNQKNGNNGAIRVSFTHPRSGDAYDAEIGPSTTARQALEGLVKAKFIDADTPCLVTLERTGKQVPLSASLMSSGVQAGDTIALTAGEIAATRV